MCEAKTFPLTHTTRKECAMANLIRIARSNDSLFCLFVLFAIVATFGIGALAWFALAFVISAVHPLIIIASVMLAWYTYVFTSCIMADKLGYTPIVSAWEPTTQLLIPQGVWIECVPMDGIEIEPRTPCRLDDDTLAGEDWSSWEVPTTKASYPVQTVKAKAGKAKATKMTQPVVKAAANKQIDEVTLANGIGINDVLAYARNLGVKGASAKWRLATLRDKLLSLTTEQMVRSYLVW